MRKCSIALAGAAVALFPSTPGLALRPPVLTSPHPPVVGGNPAQRGRWDDAAVVLLDDLPFCTGTLVAPDLVVTAGHCIVGLTHVLLGAIDLDTGEGELIPIARSIEYPSSGTTYDVGLLILERPSSIEPRVIASGCVLERYLANGAPVEIVGWGAINRQADIYPDVLMEAETVVTDVNCTGGRGCNASVSPGGEMTAGGDSIDSCSGDSGGPLYLLTDIGEYLVGITSRGYDDAQLPCGEGGIYVRADAVMDWIESESGETLPRANCNAPPAPTAEPTELEVEAGGSVTAVVAPNDPNAADTHEFSVFTAPSHGQVTTGDDGTVTYTADEDYEGTDRFVIEVLDNGVPSLSGEVEFQVTVLPDDDDGCGCRTSGQGPGSALLAALVGFLALARGRRRRRR